MRKRLRYWKLAPLLPILPAMFMSGCNKGDDDNGMGLPSVIPPPIGSVQTAVSLGSITSGGNNLAVLASSTVTNTGATVVNGDVGVWPGTAVTGFPPGNATGAIYFGVAPADAAQSSLTAAFNDAAGRPADADVAGNLGGRTLTRASTSPPRRSKSHRVT